MEGEIGVSKPALTKMYSTLINSALQAEARSSTRKYLLCIEKLLKDKGVDIRNSEEENVQARLQNAIEEASGSTIDDTMKISHYIYLLLKAACDKCQCIYENVPDKFIED